MSETDQRQWDERYRALLVADDVAATPSPPAQFADHVDLFPRQGNALDLACGLGSGSLWLAGRGVDVVGVDVSPVAIDRAADRARALGLSDRCRFEQADLDETLPDTPAMDLIVCHLYRNQELYRPMVDRLKPGGMLALAVLSEVGSGPGRFRAAPGELRQVFADHLTVLIDREAAGHAVLIGRAG